MKHLSKTALFGLIAFASSGAIAQESADLTVTAQAVPRACTPTLSSAKLDWGQISIRHEDEIVDLPMKSIDVSVSCASKTLVSLHVDDNKLDSLPAWFDPYLGWRGLGKVDGNPVSGAYQIKVKENVGTVDGGSANAVVSDNGTVWKALNSPVHFNQHLAFDADSDGSIKPSPLKTLSFTAEVSGRLNPRTLPPGEISLEGSSTFTVVYL